MTLTTADSHSNRAERDGPHSRSASTSKLGVCPVERLHERGYDSLCAALAEASGEEGESKDWLCCSLTQMLKLKAWTAEARVTLLEEFAAHFACSAPATPQSIRIVFTSLRRESLLRFGDD